MDTNKQNENLVVEKEVEKVESVGNKLVYYQVLTLHLPEQRLPHHHHQ